MDTTTARTLAETLLADEAFRSELLAALVKADAPAKVAPAPAQDETPALKVLTRGAWKAARMTKGGKVRKAFAGLTREQALEAGLLPGYRMPTGDMRAALKARKSA